MKLKQTITEAGKRFGKTAVAAVALACMAGTAFAAEFKKEEWVLVASVINTTNPYMASNIEGAKAMSKKTGHSIGNRQLERLFTNRNLEHLGRSRLRQKANYVREHCGKL